VSSTEKIGMAIHITMNSIKKAWADFDGDHVVFCLEGRSWRKDFYEPYKRNRQDAREALTEAEQEENKTFWETFDLFKDFVKEKTNCTVLQNPQLEADDLIAGWVQAHPNDNHVIISTDGDFAQPAIKSSASSCGFCNTVQFVFSFTKSLNRSNVSQKVLFSSCSASVSASLASCLFRL
jgi:5'-3' exonuclease